MPGRSLPDIALKATNGPDVNPAQIQGLCIYFCYPYTGKPGVPDPDGWDHIPGAHGSTPQAVAYSGLIDAFSRLNTQVFGLSFQNSDWQKEFVARQKLRVTLLSDIDGRFAEALALKTFNAGARIFLSRVTLIARDSLIIGMRDVIPEPSEDAAATLALVRSLA